MEMTLLDLNSSVATSLDESVSEVPLPTPERRRSSDSFETTSKQYKTRILNFLRDNYLRIICALVGVVVILITVLTALSILMATDRSISHGLAATSYSNTTGNRSTKVEKFVNTSTNIESRRTNEEQPLPVDKIPCRKIKCSNSSCEPKDLSYERMKEFSCCSCLPPRYELIRYEGSREDKALILHPLDFNPKDLSPLDVQVLPKIKGQPGRWIVQEESDKTYYLRYALYPVEKDSTSSRMPLAQTSN